MDPNRIIQALKGTIDPKLRVAAENELNQVRGHPRAARPTRGTGASGPAGRGRGRPLLCAGTARPQGGPGPGPGGSLPSLGGDRAAVTPGQALPSAAARRSAWPGRCRSMLEEMTLMWPCAGRALALTGDGRQ